MKSLYFIIKSIRYFFASKNAHGIHSPFVFELYNEVICKKNNYYVFDRIEQQRQKLLVSTKSIDVTDLGTGKSGKKNIAGIAGRSLKSKKYGQLLFRLVNRFKPETIVELGTSLGITAAYLASANPKAKIVTIEGCPNISNEAKSVFENLELKNIETVTGNFDDALPSVIRHPASVSMVFFDGNHKKAPTLKYFSQCLESATPDSVFVFDDIHWSDEMEEAWQEIKSHPKVTVTIDLFFLGIVFFRKEQVKENFILRF